VESAKWKVERAKCKVPGGKCEGESTNSQKPTTKIYQQNKYSVSLPKLILI